IRISIYSKELILVKPFLIVGLIASIRRILVITMQAAKFAEDHGTADGANAFRNAMIELGLLAVLILVFVFSIFLLRRISPREDFVDIVVRHQGEATLLNFCCASSLEVHATLSKAVGSSGTDAL